jgi:hypothetical protein
VRTLGMLAASAEPSLSRFAFAGHGSLFFCLTVMPLALLTATSDGETAALEEGEGKFLCRSESVYAFFSTSHSSCAHATWCAHHPSHSASRRRRAP